MLFANIVVVSLDVTDIDTKNPFHFYGSKKWEYTFLNGGIMETEKNDVVLQRIRQDGKMAHAVIILILIIVDILF